MNTWNRTSKKWKVNISIGTYFSPYNLCLVRTEPQYRPPGYTERIGWLYALWVVFDACIIPTTGTIIGPYTYVHSKKFLGRRKIPRSLMGNCNFPVSDQLLVQFGQILPVLDQLLVQYGQFYQFQTKICPNWTKSCSETWKLHLPISDLSIFPSTPQNFFWVCGL